MPCSFDVVEKGGIKSLCEKATVGKWTLLVDFCNSEHMHVIKKFIPEDDDQKIWTFGVQSHFHRPSFLVHLVFSRVPQFSS